MIKQDLNDWFSRNDERALRLALSAMEPQLRLPSSFSRVLSSTEIEDLRQEVLIRLLQPNSPMRESSNPEAYAKEALRRGALSLLRKKRRRESLAPTQQTTPEQAANIEDVFWSQPYEARESSLDTASILPLFDALVPKKRVMLQLFVAPWLIKRGDWKSIHEDTPPIPSIPAAPLDFDDPEDKKQAAELLYPEQPNPKTRVDNLRKTFERTCKELRGLLSQQEVL